MYSLRHLLFLALLSSFIIQVTPAFAELRAFDCATTDKLALPSAQKTLDAVQKRYSSLLVMQANFVQDSFLDALQVSEMSQGQVKFLRPGMMRWDYTNPEQQSFVVRDNTLWLYQPIEHQVIIDNFEQQLISQLPVAFLMGLGNLARDFNLTSACNSHSGVVLELQPKNSDQNKLAAEEGLDRFWLLVNPDTNLPRGAKVKDIAGNLTAIVLDQVDTTVKLDKQDFSLKPAAGIDVIDRRLTGNGNAVGIQNLQLSKP